MLGSFVLGVSAVCSLFWLSMQLSQLAVTGNKIMLWHNRCGLCKFISYVAQLLQLLAGGMPGERFGVILITSCSSSLAGGQYVYGGLGGFSAALPASGFPCMLMEEQGAPAAEP